ncbi:MAG: HNH endonuclease [Raineya sp.]
MGKVLILNQDYSAFTICSIQKAFILVYLNKADIVSESPQGGIKTVSRTFPRPSVIRLHKYVHLPYKGVVLSRQNVFKRDNYQCQYCGATTDLTLDHVLPRSRGGKSSWTNLVTACKTCNSKKGDLTPEEAQMPLNRKPFKPSFIMFLRDFSGKIEKEWELYLGKSKAKEEQLLKD